MPGWNPSPQGEMAPAGRPGQEVQGRFAVCAVVLGDVPWLRARALECSGV